MLESALPAFLDEVCEAGPPALAFYNAGTDVYEHDLLGGLGLTLEDIRRRDRFTIEAVRSRGIPCVMVTSGGYSADSYRMIADTAEWALTQ